MVNSSNCELNLERHLKLSLKKKTAFYKFDLNVNHLSSVAALLEANRTFSCLVKDCHRLWQTKHCLASPGFQTSPAYYMLINKRFSLQRYVGHTIITMFWHLFKCLTSNFASAMLAIQLKTFYKTSPKEKKVHYSKPFQTFPARCSAVQISATLLASQFALLKRNQELSLDIIITIINRDGLISIHPTKNSFWFILIDSNILCFAR